MESGHSVLINATQETTIMWCTLNEQKTLCNEYSFKDLIAHYKRSKRHWSIRENELFTLPVNSLVRQELIMAYEATTRGMLCIHYQKLKMNLIMLLLRGFYTKDDLAHLFYPILNEENEFRHAVLTAYNDQINVQELMDALNLPESTFNRKFIKVFGTTAGKFIINRKKNHILRDLLMTDLSVKEISEKFKFTPSYIVKFSKNYFGKTPTELRSERHGK